VTRLCTCTRLKADGILSVDPARRKAKERLAMNLTTETEPAAWEPRLARSSDLLSRLSPNPGILRALILTGLLLLTAVRPADAQQNYCVDASSGEPVRAGETIKRGKELLRCCRMAPISGVPSNAAFLKEEQFKKILNPHRCWSGGLRTRDFVSVKIPHHPRRGRRLGR
jgi:hypothetical protein